MCDGNLPGSCTLTPEGMPRRGKTASGSPAPAATSWSEETWPAQHAKYTLLVGMNWLGRLKRVLASGGRRGGGN